MKKRNKKIAIFHPYLNSYCLGGGGENLIFKMCEYLKADLWVGSVDFKSWGEKFAQKDDFVKKLWNKKFDFHYLHQEFTFYNYKLFFFKHIFQLLAFLKRFFFMRFSFKVKKMSQYDMVIFSYGNIFFLPRRLKKCKKLIYMHSPIRKLFDQYLFFLASQPIILKPIYGFIKLITKKIIIKDLQTIDKIIANSQNTKNRLKKFLDFEADEVIFPGLESKKFTYHSQGDFFLSYGRLDNFKRIELIVDAFTKMPDKKLVVCSHGPLAEKIKKKCSATQNIQFLGKVSDKKLKELLSKCIAGIYIPIDEDAGITQLEIMASGKPVIGVKDGGLIETVIHNKTGILLPKEVTEQDIISLIQKTEAKKFSQMKKNCQQQATKYDYIHFYQKLEKVLESNDKIKICFISLRSDSGGSPVHLYDLLRRIKKKIECYSASPLDKPFGEKFQSLSKEHFPLQHRYFSFVSFFKLLFFLKKRNIKILHSHGRGAGIYSRFLKIFSFKVIHTFHGIHKESNIKLFVDKYLKYLTDLFILVSDSELRDAERLNQTIQNKSIIIYNGLDIVNANQLFQKKKLKTKTLTIGARGRICYQKGFDILLDYIALFEKKNKIKFSLLIAGEGILKNKIRKKINALNLQKSVQLIGHVHNSYSFLSNIDVYVSTSRWEGTIPYTIMEAMYCNCPLVISNVIGNEELKKFIPDSLFNLNDYQSFEKVLLQKIKQKRINSRSIILKDFNADTMAQKTIKVYSKI